MFKKIAVIFWAFLLAAAAVASEEHRTKIEIEIDDDQAGQQSFRFDSQDAGFGLHDMIMGETRVLTGESGNTAEVTRTEDGFVLDVNGETIELGDLHDMDGPHVMHMRGGEHGELKQLKKVRVLETEDENAVTIISGKAIDEETRDRIREALRSGSQDGEVVFIDGSELSTGATHKRHAVRIIKKEVDVTN